MTDLELGCLFDGIHGFGLGMAAIGARARWTVEFADYPRKVLELRVPHAEHLVDVRDVVNPPKVRGVSGGFPCQDLSLSGLGKGISGSRSGLWTEFARIIGDVEPDVVFIENVPALLHRGMELVVANLVELGYSVEWDCLPAAFFGAWHIRDRVWIVAHKLGAPSIFGQPATLFALEPGQGADLVGGDGDDETPLEAGWLRWPRAGWVDHDPGRVTPLEPIAPLDRVKTLRDFWPTPQASDGGRGPDFRGARGERAQGDTLVTAVVRKAPPGSYPGSGLSPRWVEWLMGFPLGWTDLAVSDEELVSHDWRQEPENLPRLVPCARGGRSAVKDRGARLKALGNALVPAAPAWVASRYLEAST